MPRRKLLIPLTIGHYLINGALTALGVFFPIYFYTIFGGNILYVLALYLVLYGIPALLSPGVGKLFARMAPRAVIVLSLIALTGVFTSLTLFSKAPAAMLSLFVFSFVCYRILYWLPRNILFARAIEGGKEGTKVAVIENIGSGLLLVIPVLAGIIITISGFESAFLSALFLVALGTIAYLFIGPEKISFGFSYVDCFEHLKDKRQRNFLIGYIGDGAQGVVESIMWPLALFAIFNGEYLTIGGIASLTIVLSMVSRMAFGVLADSKQSERSTAFGIFIFALGWIGKALVITGPQAFFATAYHSIVAAGNRTSLEAVVYRQIHESGSCGDEYLVLYELALGIGRVSMILLLLVLVPLFGITSAFIAAFFFSLLLFAIPRSQPLVA